MRNTITIILSKVGCGGLSLGAKTKSKKTH